MGSMLANGISVNEIEQIILRIRLDQYWDPNMGFGLLKGERLHKLLSQFLPAQFSDLKLSFELSVFDLKKLRTKIINSGDLISAVRASSAFPGLFQPLEIGSSLCGAIRSKIKKASFRLAFLGLYFFSKIKVVGQQVQLVHLEPQELLEHPE